MKKNICAFFVKSYLKNVYLIKKYPLFLIQLHDLNSKIQDTIISYTRKSGTRKKSIFSFKMFLIMFFLLHMNK